ncbi:hypothetical protein AB0K80_04655 [Streptomyces sp. NPDC052682]|uniref:hypothetical protein n=1 Tax=Streptomyces sp. NPDC052682 TaxID=3154954 RepID=UPI003444BC3D
MLNSGRPRGGSGEWEQPFWQQRGWILSAGFLLVLVVLAVFTLMTRDDGGAPRAVGSPSPSRSTGQGGGVGGGAGGQDSRPAGCRTDDSDQEKPTAAPKDVYWKALGTGLTPASKSAGPLKFDGPVWYCYAHTPMGAVFAAHAITGHLAYPGWREVVDRQFVPGAGRDAYITKRSTVKDKSVSGRPDEVTFVGFSVLSYNKRETTLTLLGGKPSEGRYGAVSMTLRWQDGDWKIVADSHGTIYSGTSQVNSTNGFVTWRD